MISRSTLISLMVLLAGLVTGYFAYCLSGDLPAFSHQKVKSSPQTGNSFLSDKADHFFHGSSLELSHLYYDSSKEFEAVLEGGRRNMDVLRAQKDLLLRQRDTLSGPLEDLDSEILDLGYKMDLQSLMGYYSHYFMHYYRWIDTGDMPSSVSYKLAMGQFWATVDYHQNKYPEKLDSTAIQWEDMLTATHVVAQADRAVRWARVLTVLLLFLLVMGIPRFIRDRGYRKFAASLYFDALFRPSKISDINAWHNLSRVALALLLIYLFGAVILSSFTSWRIPLLLGCLGVLPVLVLIVLINKRKKLSAILLSFLSPKIMILLAVLAVMAVRGPMFFWYHVWVSDLFRAIFLALIGMLIFHKFHVHLILARKWSHRNRRGAAAMLGLASGLQCLVVGLLLKGFGPERGLQALNNDLQLLPASGPEGNGIVSWMGLSPNFPLWLILAASTLLIISFLVFVFNREAVVSSPGPRKA